LKAVRPIAMPAMGTPSARTDARRRPASVAEVYAAHGDFVYRTLQHMGVPEGDLDDVLQEVLLVVHRRLDSYEPSARVSTWLYGICRNLARRHRARARFRRERLREQPPDTVAVGTPEDAVSLRERQRLLDAVLDRMSLDKRVVFVLYEIEERSCEDIAQITGVPVGTVHSRLHAARRQFAKVLARMQRRGGGR